VEDLCKPQPSSGGPNLGPTLAFDLQTALEKLLYTLGVFAGKKSFEEAISLKKKGKTFQRCKLIDQCPSIPVARTNLQ
jgi:hypothetical protein